MPVDRPIRLPGDAEETPAPLPSATPTSKLPDDADRNPDGEMHSKTNVWPASGGPDDGTKPFKNLR